MLKVGFRLKKGWRTEYTYWNGAASIDLMSPSLICTVKSLLSESIWFPSSLLIPVCLCFARTDEIKVIGSGSMLFRPIVSVVVVVRSVNQCCYWWLRICYDDDDIVVVVWIWNRCWWICHYDLWCWNSKMIICDEGFMYLENVEFMCSWFSL